MRAAAIQLEARIADVDTNLEAAERLTDRAGAEDAECIVLPEFFTAGIRFVPELADCALAPDGEATELLLRLHHAATDHQRRHRDRRGHEAGPDPEPPVEAGVR